MLGHLLPAGSKQARIEMGVVPQLDNLDVELTARQTLGVFARIYRVPARERGAAVDQALQLANLTNRADTQTADGWITRYPDGRWLRLWFSEKGG